MTNIRFKTVFFNNSRKDFEEKLKTAVEDFVSQHNKKVIPNVCRVNPEYISNPIRFRVNGSHNILTVIPDEDVPYNCFVVGTEQFKKQKR